MSDINTNLLTKTGYSAAQLEEAVVAIRPDHGFKDFQAFVDAENGYDFDSLFILAHAIVESAWGTSFYATARNNLFGFNAVDSDPDEASSYPDQATSIHDYADFMNSHYLHSGGVYYNGATPHGVFVKYSSSHDTEAQTVVGIMNELQAKITGQPAPSPTPAPTPAPAPNPAAGTYHVDGGENLTEISGKYPGTTPQMWVDTNKAKYAQITPDFIEAGWDLIIPGGSPVAAQTWITVPSGRDGYLSVLSENYGSSVQQIIDWNKGKYPSIGTGSDAHIEAGWYIRVK